MKKVSYLANKQVSRLGFGAWPLGNTAHGKTMSIEEGVRLVRTALDLGVNFFDTAPNYALGRSEQIIGEAIKGRRSEVVINTKFGHHSDGRIDFSVDQIIPSVEGSLSRLQTDTIDSIILHNPSFDILQGKTSHFTVFESLKKARKIHGYGVSVDTVNELNAVLKQLDVDVIELLFNVFSQAPRHLFDAIEKKKIALIIKVPLDSGWLTGKYNVSSNFTDIRSRWTNEDKERRHHLVEQFKKIVNDQTITPYAMAFLWSYPAITTVIPGIRTEAQLLEHVSYEKTKISSVLREEIELFYDREIADKPLPW